MKSTLYIIAIVFLGILSQSCDHVENPYPPKYNTDLDTTIYPGSWNEYLVKEWPDFSTITNEDPNRNVLIEDFTGHNCSNCPAAATVAHDLHKGNPSRIFIASVHASPQGMSAFQEVNLGQGYTVDFTNQNGLDYGFFFGTTLLNTGFFGNPGGTVNRALEGSEYFYASGFWSTKATEVLNSTLKVAIKAKVNYYDATKGLFLHTEIEKLDGGLADENLGVIVYVIEDTLVAPQNVSSTKVDDYVHRDIMRGTITGQTWGRDLTSGTFTDGKYYLDYSYLVPDQLAPQGQTPTHNAENMHLLIYVYDKTTYEIYQVIKKAIVE